LKTKIENARWSVPAACAASFSDAPNSRSRSSTKTTRSINPPAVFKPAFHFRDAFSPPLFLSDAL
jgi:hypothetical protein